MHIGKISDNGGYETKAMQQPWHYGKEEHRRGIKQFYQHRPQRSNTDTHAPWWSATVAYVPQGI